jgi:hypothetical protein
MLIESIKPVLLDLQSKAHTSIEEHRKGTWTRPTASDPALFPGLGGCKAIVQETRRQPASSPASSEGNNLLASLDGVQPTLDEYLRSLDTPRGTSNVEVPIGITSSDDFLMSALTGNWTGLGAPLPTMPEYPGQRNLSPPKLDLPRQDHVLFHLNSTQQDGSSMFAPSPFSDGSSSSGNGNLNGAQSTFDYPPPFQPLGPSVSHQADVNGQATDTVLLWDNFLRDLGLQNVSN